MERAVVVNCREGGKKKFSGFGGGSLIAQKKKLDQGYKNGVLRVQKVWGSGVGQSTKLRPKKKEKKKKYTNTSWELWEKKKKSENRGA